MALINEKYLLKLLNMFTVVSFLCWLCLFPGCVYILLDANRVDTCWFGSSLRRVSRWTNKQSLLSKQENVMQFELQITFLKIWYGVFPYSRVVGFGNFWEVKDSYCTVYMHALSLDVTSYSLVHILPRKIDTVGSLETLVMISKLCTAAL